MDDRQDFGVPGYQSMSRDERGRRNVESVQKQFKAQR